MKSGFRNIKPVLNDELELIKNNQMLANVSINMAQKNIE